MQDDTYLITAAGWSVGNEVEWEKKEFEGKLIPKSIIISKYFKDAKTTIEDLEAVRDSSSSELEALEEEHSGDDGYFSSFEKVNKGTVVKRIKEIKTDEEAKEELEVMEQYLQLNDHQAESNKK